MLIEYREEFGMAKIPIKISQEDRDLFAKAMSEPFVIEDKDALPQQANKHLPSIDIGNIENLDIRPIGANQNITFNRSSISHIKLSKLGKGHLYNSSTCSQLDLHGLTIEQTAKEVAKIIPVWQVQNINCGLLIHGKSQQSEHAILKSFLAEWLKTLPQVLAYSSACSKDGGAGALYVLVKRV